MPTAYEYNQAAERYLGLARRLEDEARSIPAEPTAPFLDAPDVASFTTRAFEVVRSDLGAAAAELRGFARTCTARAEVCRSYARRLREWYEADETARQFLPYPDRPAGWAEA